VVQVLLKGLPFLADHLNRDDPRDFVVQVEARFVFSVLYDPSMPPKKGSGAGTATEVLLKLVILAGQAAPSPSIGPALGQQGIKAGDFCKQFNDATSKLYQLGTPLRAQIHISPANRTFKFAVKPPLTSYLLKRATGNMVEKCATHEFVGEISPQQLYEIAKVKHTDPSLMDLPLEAVFKMVTAAAKHAGFKVVRPTLSS
jgi:large subunit ribosomal protein L11